MRTAFYRAGGDGCQERFKLVLFKRNDGTFIAGLSVWGEWGEKYNFLEYRNGGLKDISAAVIPGYKPSHIYDMPRYGTTISVFERKNFDPALNQGKTGRKLYALVWKNGRFRIRK